MADIHDPMNNFYRDPEYMDHNVGAETEAEMNLAKPYDSNDEQQIEEKKRALAKEERERLDFIRKIMIMQSGRKWVYNFLRDCRVHGNPVVPQDVYMTYFLLGEQNIGKKLLADVERHTELYILMMRENH